MILDEYIEAVRRKVPDADPATIERDLDTVLKDLADLVSSASYPQKGLLRKAFTTITVTAGEATIPATMHERAAISAEITPDTSWGVTEKCQFLPDPRDLANPPDLADFVFFSVEGGKLKFVNSSGTAVSGTIPRIVANYHAAITEVPDDLEPELIRRGIAFAREGTNQPANSQTA